VDQKNIRLLSELQQLNGLMYAQMGKIANSRSGISYADFQLYVNNPDSKLLFARIRKVKAELRGTGEKVPETFPE